VRRWAFPEREQSALRECFYDVGAKLKSKYRRKNTLPWYLLLGFPQSGKSSLLRHESESAWRRIGSHRESNSGHDCDWWLADQAVIVDISGRYLQPDENRDDSQWQKFAELLQRYRKPHAVNAVIVVVSAAELRDAEEENLRQRAGLLKQCLHDLQSSSQVRIPFYLVVSKCDSLTGFSDYFASMPSEERRQVWGVALTPETGRRYYIPTGSVAANAAGAVAAAPAIRARRAPPAWNGGVPAAATTSDLALVTAHQHACNASGFSEWAVAARHLPYRCGSTILQLFFRSSFQGRDFC